MKQIFTKITSFTVALLVLFSTFSFTVEKHYCGDFLVDVSFTGNLEVCNTDIASNNSVRIKKCCKDEIQKIEGQDELQQIQIEKFNFSKEQFLVSFNISHKDLFIKRNLRKHLIKIFLHQIFPKITKFLINHF